MNYKDLWPLIQQDVLGALQAHEVIGTRKGVDVEDGDIESMLDRKINLALGLGPDGKLGVGFLVLPIEKAFDDNANMPGGPLKLSIVVQFVENVTLNRGPRGTQMPCRIWVAEAEKALKLYTPAGLTQSFVPASPVIYQFTPDKDINLRVGQVEFTAVEADFKLFMKVNRPQISVVGPVPSPGGTNSYQLTVPAIVTVSLNSQPSTLNPVIYYTTDGSHPWQGQAAAQVYQQPVAINQPCLFRCRAFAPGQVGSDTAAANFWQ